jgi:hypothetical protein
MKSFTACPVKDKMILELPKHHSAGNIMLEGMTGNVGISEVDALTYVVLSKAENHVNLNVNYGLKFILLDVVCVYCNE